MRRLNFEALEARQLLTVFGGVDFPKGASSFADEVLFYRPVRSIAAAFKSPAQALGIPNFPTNDLSKGHVTLGQGGQLGLKFTDNELTNSASTAADLWIFEVGPDVEASRISVRPTPATLPLLTGTPDSDGFYFVGLIGGATRGIDLDAKFTGFAAGKMHFDAVKIVDDPNSGDGGGSTPGADIDAVGAIGSTSVAASISITAADAVASEPGTNTGKLTIQRTGPVSQSLQVQVSYSGTATRGTDYESRPTLLTIPANSSTVSIFIKPIDDQLLEPTETVRVAIVKAGSVPINQAAKVATVSILDNELPRASLSVLDAQAAETPTGSPSNGSLLLQRSSVGLSASLSITIQLGGTAKYDVDYRILVSGATSSYNATTRRLTVTFAAGQRNAVIYVNSINDAADEPLETVTFSLVDRANYDLNPTLRTGTVTIKDKTV